MNRKAPALRAAILLAAPAVDGSTDPHRFHDVLRVLEGSLRNVCPDADAPELFERARLGFVADDDCADHELPLLAAWADELRSALAV